MPPNDRLSPPSAYVRQMTNGAAANDDTGGGGGDGSGRGVERDGDADGEDQADGDGDADGEGDGDAGDGSRHLDDVEDGAGCTEIWERLSERREE